MRTVALLLSFVLLAGSAALGASRPGPFRFCYGLDHPADFPIIKALGLDTLYLRLEPDQALNLQPVRDVIHEAQRQNLKVIIELPTCLTAAYRVSPYNEKYAGTAEELIEALVGQLKEEAGLTAWATASLLERRLDFSDADFRAYLQELYPSLEALNAHWGARMPTWPSVSLQAARDLEAKAPYTLGPAAVDCADYKAEAYRRVMARWLAAIRSVDTTRPVLTGRVTLYRSLLSIPNGYDVVCVSMPPEILENDQQAHNPQALDIARRGGKFAVLPVFRVPDNTSPAYRDGSLRDWMHVAALHGAVGMGIEDWDMLAPLYDLERRAMERGRRLTNAIRDAATVPCTLTPQATTAIIYSPYASGFEVTGQPVYGYLAGVLPGEPSNLAYALRLGTRYGVVDYLSVADLKERDLGGYGCLLAPACLNLPVPQAGQLEEFVRQGGNLMAELGLGAYQTGSWTQLPEAVAQACGIVSLGNAKEKLADLTAADGLRELQPWPRGVRAQGLFSPRNNATASATESRAYPINGWLAEAAIAEGAAPLATVAVRFDEQKRPLFSGVIGRVHGAGIAVFATHPLWQYWPLADPLSQLLHGDLMARRAGYELVQTGLLQAGLYFGGGEEGAMLYNPARTAALAQLWAYGAQSHAFTGGATQFTAAPGAAGYAPGTALLVANVPPAQSLSLDRTPLIVQPYQGEATVMLRAYTPQEVAFDVAGSGCVARPTPRGLELLGGEAASVRLILGNGVYVVAPNSHHVVTVKSRTRQTRVAATASPRGELDLSGTYAGSTVTVGHE